MSVRDTLIEIVRQWTESNGGAPETPEAVVDAYRAEVLAEADLLPKADVVAWLVKKAREGFPNAAVLASKADRGAIRPDNLRMLPPDFFVPGRVYAHDVYRFRCEFIVTHPTHGRRSAWGWFGYEGRGWRHQDFSERQFQVREWTDVTEEVAAFLAPTPTTPEEGSS